MTQSLTASLFWRTPPRETDATTAPEPKPSKGPVFIHDAIAPVGGDTLLLQLWRRWDGIEDPEDQA